MQAPHESGKSLGYYPFGTALNVIGSEGPFLAIMDRITRQFERDGHQVESTRWEKVYVSKASTGPMSAVRLANEDLNVIVAFNNGKETERYDEGKALTDYLSFELITQEEFEKKKSTAVSQLIADTTNIQKRGGVIELRNAGGKVIRRFVDKPDAEEDRQEYTYTGQIPLLNAYVVAGTYWESIDYKLINKETGKEIQATYDYPHISPDGKFLVSIYSNVYSTTADFEIYSIANNKIKLIMGASFGNWMASGNDEMFWGADGFLYVPIVHSAAFWNENGDLNNQYQCVRIGIR